MAKKFTVTNPLLSLGATVEIKDENDRVVYEAKRDWAILKPKLRIYQGKGLVAVAHWYSSGRPIRRDAWNIESGIGAFSIGPKSFAWGRKMHVEGGPYDGALLAGNVTGSRLTLETADAVQLATITSKMFSLRSRRRLALLSENEQDILFTMICMSVLQITREMEKSRVGD